MNSISHFTLSPILLKHEQIDTESIILEIKKRIQFLKNKEIKRQSCIAIKAYATLDTVYWLYACIYSGKIFVPLAPDTTECELSRIQNELNFFLISENESLTSDFNNSFEPLTEDETLAIIFSSGSEGYPKPIRLTLKNFMAHTQSHAIHNKQTPEDTWLASLPFYHVGGICVFVRALLLKQKIAFDGKMNQEKIKSWLQDERINSLSLVPTMLFRLIHENKFSFHKNIKMVLVGGAPLDPKLEAKAKKIGLSIAASYGMTEACSQIITNGLALPNVKIKLGADNEIKISTPALSPSAPCDNEGFFATGDLGIFDSQMRLTVLGRKKSLIISGGENFFPEEIEYALLTHPAILEAAIFGLPDAEWGEVICAAYALKPNSHTTHQQLNDFLRHHLAAKKVPKYFLKVSSLPRTPNGKIKRSALHSLIPN